MEDKTQVEARPITKDDWARIKEMMNYPHGSTSLLIDGFKVELCQKLIKKRVVTAVYVDGYIKGEWMKVGEVGQIPEQARRFWQIKTKKLIPEKEMKKMLRGSSKNHKEEMASRNQYQVVNCCWSSFGPLKRHFEANNKDIRVISIW
ncbi:hypothetical protein [Desulforegula conservatrix]|uniref:hypothetical protein n=1 Tax=Desulforegula conservatrix TaxID=153026 RepID=UPI0004009286|nr:hypothetical protein [Desulforegula conservatrix]